MRFLAQLPLLYRLLAAFATKGVLLLLLGAMALEGIARVEELFVQLYRHPYTVGTSIRDARGAVRFIHISMLDIIHNPRSIMDSRGTIDIEDGRLFDNLAVIEQRYLGPRTDVTRIKETARDWRAAREEILRSMASAKLTESERERLLDVEERHFRDVAQAVDIVLSFAERKAEQFYAEAIAEGRDIERRLILSSLGLLMLSGIIAWLIARTISTPINRLTMVMGEISAGNLDTGVPYLDHKGEEGMIAKAVDGFRKTAIAMNEQRWIKEQISDLFLDLQAQPDKHAFAQVLMSRLTPLMGGILGAVYLNQNDRYVMSASYGFRFRAEELVPFAEGEGLVGQCARDRKILLMTGIPADYPKVESGIGQTGTLALLMGPAQIRRRINAVIEIASLKPFTPVQLTLFEQVVALVGINLDVYSRMEEAENLLKKSQLQAEELQRTGEELMAQSEEVNAANEELRRRSEELENLNQELRVSEEELKEQREELQAVNEELNLKTAALEERQKMLEKARAEADLASRYKSEFLANMSHELRTPLNSLLILAKSLSDNGEGNLSHDQQESAQIIHESGSHLLQLINDILDLAKVESGKLELTPTEIRTDELAAGIERRFRRLCENKHLGLSIGLTEEAPGTLFTDAGKLDQIINNLLGNAIKFTDRGKVEVTIRRATGDEASRHPGAATAIAFEDTGIGIPETKIERIFQSFEQADGSPERRHAGTGLGLAISRKLARLMGGEIIVSSIAGEGSIFTLLLPETAQAAGQTEKEAGPPPERSARGKSAAALPDDRADIGDGRRAIMIVEDDVNFAKLLISTARHKGFKALHAADGASAVELARKFRPKGIVLDIGLPDIDGLTVLERLKGDPATRDIQVHIVSGYDEGELGMAKGAEAAFMKPVSREQIDSAILRFAAPVRDSERKRVLIVDGDPAARREVETAVARLGGTCFSLSSGGEALGRFADDGADCVVTDISLPDMTGETFLAKLSALAGEKMPPVVVYCRRPPNPDESLRLQEYTDCVILRSGKTENRLLEEINLFLHSIGHGIPQAGTGDGTADAKLSGKKVLVVDDDMRNAFALSKVLRGKGLTVLMAQDGHRALAQLEENPGIGIVLMDIMMPGMDGYETIKAIRAKPQFSALPIITVSARAMSSDIKRSEESGANGYITKPIDMDRLLSEMVRCLEA